MHFSLSKYFGSVMMAAPLMFLATHAAATPALSAMTNSPNTSTFVLGQSVTLNFHASGLTPNKGTTLHIKVKEAFGYEIASASILVLADAAGQAYPVYHAPANRYGYYRVEATLSDGTTITSLGSRPKGFVTYAVVADPDTRTNYGDAGSRFGMLGGFSPAMCPILSYLGVRYLMSGPGWDSLEPNSAGQFAYALSEAVANGLNYPTSIANNHATWPTYGIPLITTAGIPGWAMQPGTGTALRPNMGPLSFAGVQGFPEFAKARASGFAADYSAQSRHYYQITWEPAIPVLFGGTPEELVQYFQVTYSAIHQGDPKAVVMGPTVFPIDPRPMQQLWSAGLAKYIDAVSFHPYVKYPPEENGLVGGIRTQMKLATAAKGHSMAFVGTEHGYSSGTNGSYGAGNDLNQALADVRSTIILLGEGFKLDCAFYIADYYAQGANTPGKDYFGYYWNLNPKINYGTDKMGPKPAAPAYAAMTYWLDGTTTVGPLANLSGTQLGYRFTLRGKTILTVWDYKANTTMRLPVSASS